MTDDSNGPITKIIDKLLIKFPTPFFNCTFSIFASIARRENVQRIANRIRFCCFFSGLNCIILNSKKMASTANQENLEQRMERIRKTNEEIEKRHREAEEDKICAMRQNAMISTKSPSGPKTHAYDEVDFKYVDEANDDSNGKGFCELLVSKFEKFPTSFSEKRTLPLSTRTKDYKIFADIPPDPSYRFLYEPERDGPSSLNNNATANKQAAPINQFNKNNSSFDRRNERKSFGSKGYPNGNNRGGYGGKGNVQRSQTHHEFQTENRAGKPKNGPRYSNPNPPMAAPTNQSGRGSGNFSPPRPNKFQDEGVEKITKGNITVSVSTKDGEVKSVKVSSPPVIGSGRVGNFSQHKPQFSFDGANPRSPPPSNSNQSQSPRYPQQDQQQFHRNGNSSFNRNQTNRKSDKRNNNNTQQPQQHYQNSKPRSAGAGPGNSSSLDPALIPAVAKTNLQDRLQRNRTVTIDQQEKIKVSVEAAESGDAA
jgi:hypothetical protein